MTLGKNLRTVASDAGQLALFPAIMAVVASVVAAAEGDGLTALGFGITAAVSAGIFAGARRLASPGGVVDGAPVAVALAWLLIPVIGVFPLWLAARESGAGAAVFRDPANALFESMSAFTSTGLSVVRDEAGLSASLQLWRSMAQWLGGMGMVLFGVLVVRSSSGVRAMATEELAEGAMTEADEERAAWVILAVYGGLTGLTTVLYLVLGMPTWEAINHGLTSVATGGMTITNDSFAGYSPAIKLTTMGAMMAGGLSFAIYLRFGRRRRLSAFSRSSQARMLVFLWVLGFVLLWALATRRDIPVPVLDLAFEWTSALTTCGFSTSELAKWSTTMLLPMAAIMVVGACAGSTGGGIKLSRVVWILKRLQMRIAKASVLVPGAQRDRGYTYDGRDVDEDRAREHFAEAGVMASAWMITLAAGIFALALIEPEAPWRFVLFDATSALGGVGLSTGFVSAELGAGAKGLLVLLMWLGRLEVLTVLALLAAPPSLARAWRRAREDDEAERTGAASEAAS